MTGDGLQTAGFANDYSFISYGKLELEIKRFDVIQEKTKRQWFRIEVDYAATESPINTCTVSITAQGPTPELAATELKSILDPIVRKA